MMKQDIRFVEEQCFQFGVKELWIEQTVAH